MNFGKPSTADSLAVTAAALAKNGIIVDIVSTKDEARSKVLTLVPEGAQVMTMTSITLEETGIKDALENSGKYQDVRKEIQEKKWLGSSPEWSFGSVHAVTETGQIVIASNTGSQLPAAAYGAQHVVFVVGSQKIVKNLNEAFERIDYIIPFESKRSQKAYGLPETWETYPSKILIISREIVENRIHIIFIKEPTGF